MGDRNPYPKACTKLEIDEFFIVLHWFRVEVTNSRAWFLLPFGVFCSWLRRWAFFDTFIVTLLCKIQRKAHSRRTIPMIFPQWLMSWLMGVLLLFHGLPNFQNHCNRGCRSLTKSRLSLFSAQMTGGMVLNILNRR